MKAEIRAIAHSIPEISSNTIGICVFSLDKIATLVGMKKLTKWKEKKKW
jgi:hypothetical protein